MAAGLLQARSQNSSQDVAGVPGKVIDAVREHARPIQGNESDYFPVLDMTREASYVLLGEASHGTEEFYRTRAELTRRLIEEQDFNAVVIEGNWPAAARIGSYVTGQGSDGTAEQALGEFTEFPEWMWRNTAVRDFVEWLRERNLARGEGANRAGFYGMDLYSLAPSAQAVIEYLADIDQDEAALAAQRYAPLFQFLKDGAAYGGAVAYGELKSLSKAVKQQLEAVERIVQGREDEAAFHALQNARSVVAAEQYYRGIYSYSFNGWNYRDEYMADTVERLAAFLRRRDGYAKIVVWAHNSHLGDARATESKRRGECNLGQLLRERHANETVLIGFTTNRGTVMASDDWGLPGKVKEVRPSMNGSWERAFQEAGIPEFVLPLREHRGGELNSTLLERAIGVIYRPDTERMSHYFEARLAEQFDVVIHFAETRAVEPLGATAPGGVTSEAERAGTLTSVPE